MTFFTEFREQNPDLVLDIGNPIQGMAYDIAMAYVEFARNENGIKKVWQRADGRPVILQRGAGEIEMRSLHFQGEAKKYMKRHLFGTPIALEFLYQLNCIYILVQKVWKKVFIK